MKPAWLTLIAALLPTVAPAAALKEPARTDVGLVSGLAAGETGDVRVFKGIPFAAPPVGELRWRPPQPVKPWEGVRPCTEFGPWCPQPK